MGDNDFSGSSEFNDYRSFARDYAEHSATSPYNALYERPAIMALAGDVHGLRVLDAGCGPGLHATDLVAGGASVTGVDLSPELLEVAAERLGPSVPLHRADLGQPLPFGSASFDLVVSSLVMHYLADWRPTLREFHRVLAPGGRLVLSTHHPFMGMRIARPDDYFSTYEFTEDWMRGGRTMPMRFWHRPLRAMTDSFTAAGFGIDAIDEPDPLPAMAAVDARAYANLRAYPQFIFFGLRR